MATKEKPIHAACRRAEETRRILAQGGARCIESVQDKSGILCERWIIPGGRSIIVYATPDWHDVYAAITWENDLAKFQADVRAYLTTARETAQA